MDILKKNKVFKIVMINYGTTTPDLTNEKAVKYRYTPICKICCTTEKCKEHNWKCRPCQHRAQMGGKKLNEENLNVRTVDLYRPYNTLKQGKQALRIARVICNLERCKEFDSDCGECQEVVEKGWREKTKDAEFRSKQKEAQGHHFRGAWEVPCYR